MIRKNVSRHLSFSKHMYFLIIFVNSVGHWMCFCFCFSLCRHMFCNFSFKTMVQIVYLFFFASYGFSLMIVRHVGGERESKLYEPLFMQWRFLLSFPKSIRDEEFTGANAVRRSERTSWGKGNCPALWKETDLPTEMDICSMSNTNSSLSLIYSGKKYWRLFLSKDLLILPFIWGLTWWVSWKQRLNLAAWKPRNWHTYTEARLERDSYCVTSLICFTAHILLNAENEIYGHLRTCHWHMIMSHLQII